MTSPLPEPLRRRIHGPHRDESPDRSLPPPMASLSVVTNMAMKKGNSRYAREPPLPDQEWPSISRVEYDHDCEYSDLFAAALQRFEVAEDSGFTNSEALIQGLNFMIRAAGLGNENAIAYLSDFVLNVFPNVIPEDGPAYHEVRNRIQTIDKFLSLNRTEKNIWKSALNNFLTMSGRKKALPRKKFDDAVYSLLLDVKEGDVSAQPAAARNKNTKNLSIIVKKLLREALKISPHPDEAVEEAYCLTVVEFTMGRLSVEFDPEDMTEQQIEEFHNAPVIEKLLAFPMKASGKYILKQELPKYVERNGMRWLRGFLPYKEILFFIAAFFALSLNQFVAVGAFCLFWPCFCGLVMVTFMLLSYQDQAKKSFDVWKRFLSQQQGVVVETRASQVHELTQISDYYTAMFVLFVLTLFLFSGAKEILVLPEVLVGISALMFLACVLIRKFWKKKVLLSAAMVKVAIMIVCFVHKAPGRFLQDLMTSLLPDFIQNMTFVQRVSGFLTSTMTMIPNALFYFAYIPLSVVHVLVLVLILRGLIGSWKMHFYAISGPFIAGSVWWVLWMVFFHFVMGKDVINWTWLTVSHVPVLIPFSILKFVITFTIMYGLRIMFVGIFFSMLLVCLAGCYRYGKRISKIPQLRYIKFDHLFIFFVMILPLLLLIVFADVFVTINQTETPMPIKWEDYLKHCGPSTWVGGNMAKTQIRCSSLIGRRSVRLYGFVDSVRVSERENMYETVFNKVSDFGRLKDAGYCFFGKSSDLCDPSIDGDTPINEDTPTESDSVCGGNSCNLYNHNSFKFIIKIVSVQDEKGSKKGHRQGSDVTVFLLTTGSTLGHEDNALMNDIIPNLKANDLVRFNATFNDGLGSDLVSMNLESIAIEGTDYSYNSKEWKKMAGEEKYSQMLGFLITCTKSSVNYLQTFVLGTVYYEL